jgi:hypothetical protein
MYRAISGQVHVKGWSVIEDRGYLQLGPPGSDQYYWLSGAGVGVSALVLLGPKQDILNWLRKRSHKGIRNVISELPEIYMGVSAYHPGRRFVGLFPLQDALQALTEGLASFVPGSSLTDVVGGFKDLKENIHKTRHGFKWFSKSKSEKKQKWNGDMYVKFHYLRDRGKEMILLGKKKVKFKTVYDILATAWHMQAVDED